MTHYPPEGVGSYLVPREELKRLWEAVETGDSAPPYVFEVTAEKIAGYSRAARYENPVYTNQLAAREAGLPGIIAPPAMLFAYAPLRLAQVAASRGCALLPGLAQNPWAAPSATVAVEFQGTTVAPGDTITSVTSVRDKSQREGQGVITFQVTAHNQRGETVAVYTCTCRWPVAPGSV